MFTKATLRISGLLILSMARPISLMGFLPIVSPLDSNIMETASSALFLIPTGVNCSLPWRVMAPFLMGNGCKSHRPLFWIGAFLSPALRMIFEKPTTTIWIILLGLRLRPRAYVAPEQQLLTSVMWQPDDSMDFGN